MKPQTYDRLKLWFFRNLTEEQRIAFFELNQIHPDKVDTLNGQAQQLYILTRC